MTTSAASGTKPPPKALDPSIPLSALPGVTARHVTRLDRLDLRTVADLLRHLPRRYDDTREVIPVRALRPGEVQTVRATVRHARTRPSPHRRMTLVEATVEDATGVIEAVWFNQPFLIRQLVIGSELFLSGKVQYSRTGLTLRNPTFEAVSSRPQHVGRLAPVYPETEGLTSRFFRTHIAALLDAGVQLPDPLPPAVLEAEGLPTVGEAIRGVHTPSDLEEADRARRRLAFDELFIIQLAAERARRRRLSGVGVVVDYDVDAARAFTSRLPFALTTGQRRAAHEILRDMAGTGPMNRLLQGDVGSGKTVIAAMAMVIANAAGYQSVLMAPTEILARQHHQTLQAFLTAHGIDPRLLVGSTGARARREIFEGLASGQDPVVVGTHALIEDPVVFANLGLVVVDEQHRFGVGQRQRLRLKSGALPNFLAMTATPIPRSLALTFYGDVDVSELREMPPGRLPVRTEVVPPAHRQTAYQFVRGEIAAGRQAFVICPIIDESDRLGVRSATAEHQRLQDQVFPDLRVELLHGRMPAREKDQRMARFAAGAADVLVATSVVEVGVDVPNASVMIIEGAERFGLAQLHQFRGRVGRGQHESHCLLFQSGVDAEGSQRLAAVASHHSGFDLADIDLRLRGAGDLAGRRQHGMPALRAADLFDVALAQRARERAQHWLDHDPDLVRHPPLRDAMHGFDAVFDLD